MKSSFFYLLSGVFILLLTIIAFMGPRTLLTDVTEYHCYANIFWTGRLQTNHKEQQYCLQNIKISQFRKFSLPQQYPFLSVLIFSLPLLSIIGYSLSFRLLMLVFLLSIWGYFAKNRLFIPGIAFLLMIMLGLSSVAFNRYDLAASSLTFFAFILAIRKKFLYSYLILAVAAFLKIYPLFLFPIIFISNQQALDLKRFKLQNYYPLLSGLLLLVLFLLFSLRIDFTHTISPLQYQSARPLQIESIPAAVFFLFNENHACLMDSFGSINILSTANHHCAPDLLSQSLGNLSGYLMFVSVFMVYYCFAKHKLHFLQAIILSILGLMIFNKVLSPQYFLWIAPFVALYLNKASLQILFWLLLFALTYLIYPIFYSNLQFWLGGLFATILGRNILLITLYGFTWKTSLRS